MDAYIQGAFYASGFGNHAITNLSVDGNKVTFSVDGNATEIAAYTNKGKMVGEGNSMQVTIPKGVNFIRFEALYDEDEKKDFICTQPLFIEDNQDNDSAKRMLIL
jgi:Zn/Cd-binding protein ZinT